MKSLSKTEYLRILRKMDYKGYSYRVADTLKEWDEARTDLNPDARWYDDIADREPGTGYWEKTRVKDKYLCSTCREKFKIQSKMGIPLWRFCPVCGTKNNLEGDSGLLSDQGDDTQDASGAGDKE